MMYNPQLDTFICVVEAGSFSKAAEELYISAPAVIKQINSLENSLNLQLFERTHRGLIITEAGKSLYQDAKYLIQYSKESLIRAQEAMNHNEEIIRVGISPMTPPEVFVELWPKIQKIYPEMKFKLITFENTPENAREILANMGKNIDVIAGIFDETMLELRGCDGTEISREPFCVAVSIHHRLAKKEKITLDDLAGENLMLMRRGWSYYVDKVIFSCKALNEDLGIMESKEAFGTTKKAMINSGKMRILVVDSTKFDQTAFSVAGQLRDIETIITDKKPSEKWLDHFNRHKIECIYPK